MSPGLAAADLHRPLVEERPVGRLEIGDDQRRALQRSVQ